MIGVACLGFYKKNFFLLLLFGLLSFKLKLGRFFVGDLNARSQVLKNGKKKKKIEEEKFSSFSFAPLRNLLIKNACHLPYYNYSTTHFVQYKSMACKFDSQFSFFCSHIHVSVFFIAPIFVAIYM